MESSSDMPRKEAKGAKTYTHLGASETLLCHAKAYDNWIKVGEK